MIISASRRTDIPAFYSDWFLNRLEEGYVLIPYPRDPDRLARVELSRDKVDCLVFWTKNPAPLIHGLSRLNAFGYPYYLQFTLTPYRNDIEQNLPSKRKLLQTFLEMSRLLGSERVIWRYDPIFIDTHHTVAWHQKHFEELCDVLGGHTRRCVLSFIDSYSFIGNRYRELTDDEVKTLASVFSVIAQPYGIALTTCAEKYDLTHYGIAHGACIDKGFIESLTGTSLLSRKDAYQRSACNCIESIDVGVYNTCAHGCTYCYATTNPKIAKRCLEKHDPRAPLLTGYPKGHELIIDRTTPSQVVDQLRLF